MLLWTKMVVFVIMFPCWINALYYFIVYSEKSTSDPCRRGGYVDDIELTSIWRHSMMSLLPKWPDMIQIPEWCPSYYKLLFFSHRSLIKNVTEAAGINSVLQLIFIIQNLTFRQSTSFICIINIRGLEPRLKKMIECVCRRHAEVTQQFYVHLVPN